MAHDTETPNARNRAALRLDLPGVPTRTPEQIRGACCVWCASPLNAATAVDLGRRMGSFTGMIVPWFPRGCRTCMDQAVKNAYEQHPNNCEQCVDDPRICEIRQDLTRLWLEVGR